MSTVLIGCPVYQREWILPYWFKAIERQNFPTNQLGFIFELGPNDDATHDQLWEWHEKHPEFIVFQGDVQMNLTHRTHPEGSRFWNEVRYLTMATLRNNLMEKAAQLKDQFDYYFSLDSDILLKDVNTLNRLIDYSEHYPDTVISPLTYMTPDSDNYPSIMSWRHDSLPGIRAERRVNEYPLGQPFIADVVMAAVLMPKNIYTTVRYRGHRQGEDLGFAGQLMQKGFKSLAATDIYCVHVMHRYMMESHVYNWLDLE